MKSERMVGFSIAVLLGLAAANAAGDTPNRWTPAETLKYRTASDVQVSPDGRRVAYVVREPVMESDKSEYRTQLWLSSTDGKRSFPVTFAEQSSRHARWSPDGEWIAFISKRTDKKSNIWLLRASGGEGERLTDSKSDVSEFAWAPDGKHIAFVTTDPAADDWEKRQKEKDDARVVDGNEKFGRLWVLAVSPDSAGKRTSRQLTKGSMSVGNVSEDGGSADSLDWSPDARTIAFAHTPTSKLNDWTLSDISVVDVSSGSVRPLAATGAAESSPRFSPDGGSIAYVATDDPPRWARKAVIRLAPAAGGAARDLSASHDEQPGLVGWSGKGDRIYFSDSKGVSLVLYSQDVSSGAIQAMTSEGEVVGSANLNGNATWIGFTRHTPAEPMEVYASPLAAFRPARVSEINRSMPRHPLGKTEVIAWKGDGGEPIEGLLTYPVGYEPGRKYPLLLVIHGGPAGVFRNTYVAAPGPYPTAVFAAEGYAVLRPNPRGSSGYGVKFRRANWKDWGGGDYKDLMAGVDRSIEMGVADPEKLGVMGWSYGGFMTSWIVTQTSRFKAASVGAGVTNLVSFTGTADIPSFLPDYFGGEPWEKEGWEVYRSHSAMGHVQNVKTPTLIQHGEADLRVPISQGYELYNALKRRGVPTKMVVYPRQPHGVREPRLIRDLAERNLAWFDKYVKGKSGELAGK